MDLLQLADNKKAHIHPHVKCDLCKTAPIVGIRFKCSVCDDYDECESCVKDVKKSHFGSLVFFDVEKEHTYWAYPSRFAYTICDTKGCHKELRNMINNCKTCSNKKILFMYCDTCLNGHHKNHDIIEVNVKDIVKSNERLLKELRMQRNNDEQKEAFLDIAECSSCQSNGVSFKGHTYGYTNKFLCKDCFAKGWGFFSIGFSRINKEDVTNIKQEELKRLKNYEWDQLILESLRKS
jgi:hypothetical protein